MPFPLSRFGCISSLEVLSDSGCRVSGLKIRVSNVVFPGSGLEPQVSGLGYTVRPFGSLLARKVRTGVPLHSHIRICLFIGAAQGFG